MEYISCAEAAAKWGISERRVQKLCEGERIPGAVKFSRVWRGKVQPCLADTQRRGEAD